MRALGSEAQNEALLLEVRPTEALEVRYGDPEAEAQPEVLQGRLEVRPAALEVRPAALEVRVASTNPAN